ncbi:MAG: tRNA lysidine(34) synthetase TilS, partial [Rhizobiales bacterium]|nr:tRNA lysidine(34) synthetase TilS [Hyphomicrobiales bacterium]
MPAAEASHQFLPAGADQLSVAAALKDVTTLAVAVSGGSDSMALMRMVAALPGKTVSALTVDHGLRPGSLAEAEQVSRWCAALAIPHHILPWLDEKPTHGIQAKARTARYDLMTAWCQAHQVPVLLTAHTLNDQAETVMMRKLRTSSDASLAGIWPETVWNGIRVIRPLLNVSRCALRAALKRDGQGWLDDPSNENDRFERVRIRRALRSADMASLGGEAAAALARSRADAAAAQQWLSVHACVHGTGHITVPRGLLTGTRDEVALRIMSRLVHACGGKTPERAEVMRILAALNEKGPFRRSLGGALIAARTGEVLLGREPGRIAAVAVGVPPGG